MNTHAHPTGRAPVPRTGIVAHDAVAMSRGLAQLVPDLKGRAMRLCADRTVSEDLVQDTIERALRFASQYEFGTNLRAWAYQILFSVFVTRYRRQRRERRALKWLTSDPCAWTQSAPFSSPEVGAGFTPSTAKAVEDLPVGFRSVVMLIDVGSCSYKEAARELGLPVGTVMSRLHRGRKLLASRLQESVRRREAA